MFPYVLSQPIDFHASLKIASEETPDFVTDLARYFYHVFLDKEKSYILAFSLFSSPHTKENASTVLREFIKQPEDVLTALHLYLEVYGKPLPNRFKKTLEEIFQTFTKEDFQYAKTQSGSVDFHDFLRLVHPTPRTQEQRDHWGELAKNSQKRTLDVYRDIHQMMHVYSTESLISMIQREKHIPSFHVFQTIRFLQKRNLSVDKQLITSFEERLVENVKALPKLKGKTFIASDISASMDQPLSPTDFTTYRDIAQFFMMSSKWQCEKSILSFYASEFDLFSEHFQETPMDMFQRMEERSLGYENHATKPIQYLLDHMLQVERILLFSDKPSFHEDVMPLLNMYQKNVNASVDIHLFYLAGEREKVYKQGNIHYYSGWNSSFYPLLSSIEHPISDLVDLIEQKKKTSSP